MAVRASTAAGRGQRLPPAALLLLRLLLCACSHRWAVVGGHSAAPPSAAAATARYREAARLLGQCCCGGGGGGGGQAGVGRRHRRGPESDTLLAEAHRTAAAAVELDPSRWQHRNLLGEVYLQQQNWDGAAQEFLATTQLDNQVASAFLKLGYALSKIVGYQDKALESRLIAARLNTDFADLDDEWNSRVLSRIQPIERDGESVMVEPPPLAPPLAIVIPYRDRAEHLDVLVPALSQVLDRQERQRRRPGRLKTENGASPEAGVALESRYRIFVVEQANDKRWNKGIVYNAGFHHIRSSRRYGAPECFVFHDVDFIPQNDGIHYGCVSMPTHLSAAPSQYTQYQYGTPNQEEKQQQIAGVPYASFFGGVLQMSARHFIDMNGYSNRYWLWGKEDDDLYTRLLQSNTSNGLFARESPAVGKYKCLDHERDYSNVGSNVELLISAVVGEHDYRSEGLSTVNYTVVSEEVKIIYSPGADPAVSNHEGTLIGKDRRKSSSDGAHEGKSKKSKNKRSVQAASRGARPPKGYPYTHIKVDF